MELAKQAREISPFLVMEVLEAAQRLEREGAHVIHLEVGEPDFDTPACVTEAALKALREGKTHYTHSMGILDLRLAICEEYRRRYGVAVTPERVVVTQGTSPALFMVFSALLEPGDEVILANPYYACYPNYIRFVGGVPVFVDIREEEGYQLRPEEIAKQITPRTKAILINTVANPTGVVLDAERMAAIARLGPPVISDEIYHGLVYEGREHSILEFSDNACALNGFSKLYAMTGWRLGYVIAPPALARGLQKIQQNFFISANSFVQWGAILLREAKVATGPGIDFGSNAEGYLRFSYATSLDNIREGMDRLGRYLAKLG